MEKSELLIVSLLFKKALSKLFIPNNGIIIKVENDMKPMFPGIDKVIIYKDIDDEVKIIEYDGDLEDGEGIEIEFN